MITNEDFENVEEAMLVIEGWGNQDRDMRLIEAEDVVYEFVRKILYEARRDFLTEENPPSPLEDRVKNLEASAENTRAALERLCIVLAWKASPSISGTEACDVIDIARGEK